MTGSHISVPVPGSAALYGLLPPVIAVILVIAFVATYSYLRAANNVKRYRWVLMVVGALLAIDLWWCVRVFL